jgi:Na+-transporting NADH:ubiquinone oxidoreductase subunit C
VAHSNAYTIAFMAGVCVVCSALVSGAAVMFRDRQEANVLRDRQKNVLIAAGLVDRRAKVSEEEIEGLFDDHIETVVVRLEDGEIVDDVDPRTYDARRAAQDPNRRRELEDDNPAGLVAVPHLQHAYLVTEEGGFSGVVLPISGRGLWSTLHGYLALGADLTTVRGIAFYEHGETPGLGGEVDNPRWRASWRGRRAYDDEGEPVIRLVKGRAASARAAPHEVDGLSGATITANGVTGLVRFWLGDQGFAPFLKKLKAEGRGR